MRRCVRRTGVVKCHDSHGARAGSGRLFTGSGGTFTYSVTAVSRDGLRSSTSITYNVLGPPTPTAAPTITGATSAGGRLNCSDGGWTGQPETYSFRWLRNHIPVVGARSATYEVQSVDEGSTLACVVVARNRFGTGNPTPVGRIVVPVPKVRGCPQAHGAQASPGSVLLASARVECRAISDQGKSPDDHGDHRHVLSDPRGDHRRLRVRRRRLGAHRQSAIRSGWGRIGSTLASARLRFPTGRVIRLIHAKQLTVYVVAHARDELVLVLHQGVVTELGLTTQSIVNRRSAVLGFFAGTT